MNKIKTELMNLFHFSIIFPPMAFQNSLDTRVPFTKLPVSTRANPFISCLISLNFMYEVLQSYFLIWFTLFKCINTFFSHFLQVLLHTTLGSQTIFHFRLKLCHTSESTMEFFITFELQLSLDSKSNFTKLRTLQLTELFIKLALITFT